MFWVVNSLSDSFTWFIFRENKQEVTVRIKNNLILPTHELSPEEREYFKEQILEKGHKIIK